jgi:hypothetical protein
MKRIGILILIFLFSFFAVMAYFNFQQIKKALLKFSGKDTHRKVYLLSQKNNELASYSWSPDVCINEISFTSGLKDDSIKGHFWVELFNPGNKSYNLSRHVLNLKNIENAEWVFPNRNIPPRGYLLVQLSGLDKSDYYADLHTNFSASPNDFLLFGRLDENLYQIIDSVELTLSENGKSLARIPDGKAFGISQSRPGIANNKAGIVLMLDDKRIDNHIEFRKLFSKSGARFTFDINASYRCQFHKKDNEIGLYTDFGEALSDNQIENYRTLVQDGHELGNHHYNHIRVDEYINKHGEDEYLKRQIFSMDSIFEKYNLPLIKSFVYSNHIRNIETDELLKLRYYNFRGVSSDTLQFKWQNERLLSGFRLDHRAEQPEFLYEILFDIMPGLIKSESVAIMWGHGVTNLYEPVNFYTSDRTLSILIQRARELGLKFYTQSELYALTNPIQMSVYLPNPDKSEKMYDKYPSVSLKNISDYPIDLKGFYLNKNKSIDKNYQIAENLILQPYDSCRFFFAENNPGSSNNRFHVNMHMDTADRIYLLWPDNQTVLCRQIVGKETLRTSVSVKTELDSDLLLSVFDQNDHLLPNDDFDWYSSDDSLIIVDNTGVIRSKKRGKAEIAIKSKFTGEVLKVDVLVF